MSAGIKDKVAVVGMGCTRFGEHWEISAETLMVEAYLEALGDAGIAPENIDGAWLSTTMPEVHVGKTALPLASALRLPHLPVTRVENLCASGTEAFRAAVYAVASGACETALVLGMEKLKDVGYGGLPTWGSNLGSLAWLYMPRATAVGSFACLATGYQAKWGLPLTDLKTAMAEISVKNHRNGALNPKAHLRRPIDREKALKAPMISFPLSLYDCCGVSDGAAAAIITTVEKAKTMGVARPVTIRAIEVVASNGEEIAFDDWDGDRIPTTEMCARRAYAAAGISDPQKEIDIAELHDCFSITELVTYEDLGFSKRGEGWKDVLDGKFHHDGLIPCQMDGGLKCFGHPIGASGIRMIYEVYLQLLERAGERQLDHPRIGLTHNLGGYPHRSVAAIAILGRE